MTSARRIIVTPVSAPPVVGFEGYISFLAESNRTFVIRDMITTNDKIFVFGYYYAANGIRYGLAFRLDYDLNIEVERYISHTGGHSFLINAAILASNGDIYLAGESQVTGPGLSYAVFRLDTNLNIVSARYQKPTSYTLNGWYDTVGDLTEYSGRLYFNTFSHTGGHDAIWSVPLDLSSTTAEKIFSQMVAYPLGLERVSNGNWYSVYGAAIQIFNSTFVHQSTVNGLALSSSGSSSGYGRGANKFLNFGYGGSNRFRIADYDESAVKQNENGLTYSFSQAENKSIAFQDSSGNWWIPFSNRVASGRSGVPTLLKIDSTLNWASELRVQKDVGDFTEDASFSVVRELSNGLLCAAGTWGAGADGNYRGLVCTFDPNKTYTNGTFAQCDTSATLNNATAPSTTGAAVPSTSYADVTDTIVQGDLTGSFGSFTTTKTGPCPWEAP